MKGYIILAILLTFYNYRYDTKVKLLLHCKWQNLRVSHALNLYNFEILNPEMEIFWSEMPKQKNSETIEV